MNRPSIEDLAYRQFGQPASCSANELRFGSKGGRSVKLAEQVWYDHETGEGGGYVDLYEMVYGHAPPKGIAERRKAEGLPEEPTPEERIGWARELWATVQPATGTRVEKYLRARNITMPVPDTLRYVPSLWHKRTDTYWPAMIAPVLNRDGKLCAVHRTWLHHIKAAKAPITPDKAMLGLLKGMGAAIRLAPAGQKLVVAEGVENALCGMALMELPAWAAGFAVNLPQMVLPPIVREVLILADGDDAGRRCAEQAAWRWKLQGVKVRIHYSPDGMDLNDEFTTEERSP